MINQAAIKFLYFDLGNVLLAFDRHTPCRQIGALVNASADDVEQLLYSSGLQDRYEDGQLTSRQFYEHFCDVVGARPEYPAFRQAASDMFELNVSVVPILHKLARAGYPLGVLSNTCEMHWHHISSRYRGVYDLMSQAVLSYEVRCSKPLAGIYQEAIRRAGQVAASIFFVDDRPENVAGAQHAGMTAVLFEGPEQLDQALRGRGVVFVDD